MDYYHSRIIVESVKDLQESYQSRIFLSLVIQWNGLLLKINIPNLYLGENMVISFETRVKDLILEVAI